MMTTLPSPPLSPMDTSYTTPNLMTNAPNPKSGYRKKAHHRHPPRRHDTFELIQALVIEHQRLEQQEYETMLREAPMISCRNTTNAPKGILVKNNNNNNNNNNSHPNNKSLIITAPSSSPRRTATTTTAATTPTLNNSLPQSPHDTNDHLCSTTTSTVPFSTPAHPRHLSSSSTAASYSPPSSIGSSVPSSPSTSSLVSSSSPTTTSANSYSSSSISSPSSSSSSTPPTHITRHHVVRFAPGPPKVYTYQRVPILQES